METVERERDMKHDDEASAWPVTLLALGALAYVVGGLFWMDAHGSGDGELLTISGIFLFLRDVFLWPLSMVGVF